MNVEGIKKKTKEPGTSVFRDTIIILKLQLN